MAGPAPDGPVPARPAILLRHAMTRVDGQMCCRVGLPRMVQLWPGPADSALTHGARAEQPGRTGGRRTPATPMALAPLVLRRGHRSLRREQTVRMGRRADHMTQTSIDVSAAVKWMVRLPVGERHCDVSVVDTTHSQPEPPTSLPPPARRGQRSHGCDQLGPRTAGHRPEAPTYRAGRLRPGPDRPLCPTASRPEHLLASSCLRG